MALFVKFRSKTPLGGSNELCCWCYEISTDQGNFQKGERWGLGFGTDIDIKTPDNYASCNNYNLGFKGTSAAPTNWVVSTVLEEEVPAFDVFLIAPTAENKETFVTLEYWAPDTGVWSQVNFKGWHEMLGPAGEG